MKAALTLWLMHCVGYLYGRFWRVKLAPILPPVAMADDPLINGTMCAQCRMVTYWFFVAPESCPHCGRRCDVVE